MSIETWLSSIGAVTGVFGAVLAVITHRHATSLVRTNVLHDVEVAHDKATRSAVGLLELLPLALRSRKGIASARGGLGGGRVQLFTTENASDTTAAEALNVRVAAIHVSVFARMSYGALMKQLTTLQKLQGDLDELTQKYEASMAEDRNERDHYLADRRAAGPPSHESGYRGGPRE